jgi:hypothetical protein
MSIRYDGSVMAILILGGSCCSICHDVLHVDEAIVATTHFIKDETDPLWRFSDTGMHRHCYESWEHREEFTKRYRELLGGMYPGSHYCTWPD